MASICGRSRGLCSEIVQSTLPISYFCAQQRRDALQQNFRVDARIFVRRVGEVLPDVAQGRRAQQGVAYGMDRRIAVGVCDAPFRVGYFHPAEDRTQPLAEGVHVESVTYSEIRFHAAKVTIFRVEAIRPGRRKLPGRIAL